MIYPSPHSRRDVEEAASAPHGDSISPHPQIPAAGGHGDDGGGERIFPTALRPTERVRTREPGDVAWRFRVPDGRTIAFHDALQGPVHRTAGVDFGDFVVWRRDRLAAYELAVVADDHAMEIEEVVRGADLLTSTARQILLYETLGWLPPAFCHAPLVVDAGGQRLAKRAGGLSIRDLRAAGCTPADVLHTPIASLVARTGPISAPNCES